MEVTLFVLASTFVATNIDGFAVLALLFALDMPASRRRAIASACAAFVVILAISASAAFTVRAFAPAWARWFGLLLITMGIVRAIVWLRSKRSTGPVSGTDASAFSAVLLTGGDNVAVYVGLFANLGAAQVALTSVLYLVAFGLSTYGLLLLLARGRVFRVQHLNLEPFVALCLIVVGTLMATKTFLP